MATEENRPLSESELKPISGKPAIWVHHYEKWQVRKDLVKVVGGRLKDGRTELEVQTSGGTEHFVSAEHLFAQGDWDIPARGNGDD